MLTLEAKPLVLPVVTGLPMQQKAATDTNEAAAPAIEKVNDHLRTIYKLTCAIEDFRHGLLNGKYNQKNLLDACESCEGGIRRKLLELSNLLPDGFGIAEQMNEELNRVTLEQKCYESFDANWPQA